jgi:hypothetical protein
VGHPVVHEIAGEDLLNLIEGYLMDAALAIVLALSDFHYEMVVQLVGIIVLANGEKPIFLSNSVVKSLFLCPSSRATLFLSHGVQVLSRSCCLKYMIFHDIDMAPLLSKLPGM